MKEKTYFGLEIYDNIEKYVLESYIKKLLFYAFWKESARGTTCVMLDVDIGIFLHDWELFNVRCPYMLYLSCKY